MDFLRRRPSQQLCIFSVAPCLRSLRSSPKAISTISYPPTLHAAWPLPNSPRPISEGSKSSTPQSCSLPAEPSLPRCILVPPPTYQRPSRALPNLRPRCMLALINLSKLFHTISTVSCRFSLYSRPLSKALLKLFSMVSCQSTLRSCSP